MKISYLLLLFLSSLSIGLDPLRRDETLSADVKDITCEQPVRHIPIKLKTIPLRNQETHDRVRTSQTKNQSNN